MPTTTVDRPVGAAPAGARTFNMRLRAPEFISEHGIGRVPAGGIVAVDEATAIRWEQRHIADPAPEGAKTHKQERREALLAELEALGDEDEPYRQAITRDDLLGVPRPMPTPRRGPKPAQGAPRGGKPARRGRSAVAPRPTLAGAEVVNDPRSGDPDVEDD